MMEYRNYDPTKDKSAVHRIWREIGWLEKGKEELVDLFVECGRALVADLDGEAECLVISAPGTIRYLDEELPLSCITGVATSRIARKQGLASGLTAHIVAADAAEGALVSGLGMFEQGYYDQLGFGSGGYEHWVGFDPSSLTVKTRDRVPRRITAEDWEKAHIARLTRFRGHGACNLAPPEITKAEMLWTENGFGLGYYDGPNGELTHYVWYGVKDVEPGPYHVEWMAFQTSDQFLELMALIKSLGDQVRLVRMREPQGIQFQDLLEQPFKQRQVSEKSKFESSMHASAYWQMRICDLPGCMARTHLRGDDMRFNLKLTDPIERFLDDEAPWHGVAGDYVVTLGPSSNAQPGVDASPAHVDRIGGGFHAHVARRATGHRPIGHRCTLRSSGASKSTRPDSSPSRSQAGLGLLTASLRGCSDRSISITAETAKDAEDGKSYWSLLTPPITNHQSLASIEHGKRTPWSDQCLEERPA